MTRRTLLLRVGLLAAVAAALADPRPFAGRRATSALEVLDVSASMGPGASAPSAATGAEWLAVGDGWRWVPASGTPPALSRDATTLGAALHDAAARHPGRDVVVTTDGRATDDALAGARAVRAAGGRLHPRVPARPAADVGLLDVRATRGATGSSVQVDVRLTASTAGRVRVVLSRDRSVAEEEVAVAAGASRGVRLVDGAPPDGLLAYTVRVVPLAGTPNDDPGNDEVLVGVRQERRLVLVWGGDTGAPRTADDGPRVETTQRLTAAKVDAADVVVLAGVPWTEVGAGSVELLTRFVAGGGRLLVLGGPVAYGPGGWAGTPLERALLPLVVRTPPGDDVEWVVALDVSGSTHGEPLRGLVAAAKEALGAIRPGERLAVLPFTGHAHATPLAPGSVAAGDAPAAERLGASLDALVGGGRTDLVAGVGAALDLLAAGPASRQRRLLLLTDGDPDRSPSVETWQQVAARVKGLGVRFGALVFGKTPLLEVLRRSGAVDRDGAFPVQGASWLARELVHAMSTQRASAERERLGAPEELEASTGTWADLLPRGWLPAGVHDVEAHQEARVVGRARWSGGAVREVPFAGERTVGAGTVQALAWGPGHERDPDVAWRALVPLLQRLLDESDRGLAADLDEDGRLTVRVPEAAGAGRLWLLDAAHRAELLEVAPALFRTVEPAPESDALRLRGGEGSAFAERTLRLPHRPPAEHRGAGPDLARLAALAEAGGGRVLAPGEAPPAPAPARGPSLAPWLLLAACILLVLDRARA